jgi:HK97 family phage major capsid protein
MQRPLTLLDFLPSIPISASKYEYVQISRTNNANVQQDEGDQKPETEFDSELVDASIATVAHWTQASRQVLSDSPQLGTMLRNVLAVDAFTKFETLLISGNGTTDKIDGLVNQATVLMTSGSIAPDVISSGLGIMFNNGYPASVVVMNPLDWAASER